MLITHFEWHKCKVKMTICKIITEIELLIHFISKI